MILGPQREWARPGDLCGFGCDTGDSEGVALSQDLCMSRHESGTIKGVDLKQRPLQYQPQTRKLYRSGSREGHLQKQDRVTDLGRSKPNTANSTEIEQTQGVPSDLQNHRVTNGVTGTMALTEP